MGQDEKPIYGLLCVGGGAHGAYQTGVLKYIHEHFCVGAQSPFKVFSGISAGSLNTSFYAAQSFDAYNSRLWLEELWLNFHVPEYHGNMTHSLLKALLRGWKGTPHRPDQATWSILDPTPMQDVIRRGFLRANLERSFQERSTLGISIAMTELVSGRTVWFLDGPNAIPWNLFHSIGIKDDIKPEHVAASCSVPVFMPPVKIKEHYYLDGNLTLGRPFSAAVSQGATRILHIASQMPRPSDLPRYRQDFKPRIGNVFRLLIGRLGHDAASDEATQIEHLNRFYEELPQSKKSTPTFLRHPLFHKKSELVHYKPVEICMIFPSRHIREVSTIPTAPHEPGGSHRTRFMFHRKFIRELIDLGYQDASAKHDTLRSFLSDRPNRSWKMFRTGRPEDE